MTLEVGCVGCDIYLAIPCMKFMSFHVSLAFLVISTNHWVVLVEKKLSCRLSFEIYELKHDHLDVLYLFVNTMCMCV